MYKFNRKSWLLLLFPAALLAMYLAGPCPQQPVYNQVLPVVPAAPAALEAYINANESRHKLKPDNNARIVWANDSLKNKTPYAIVYLHGFAASQAEGDPVHRQLAKEFGCNLYLSRLAEHGIDTINPMIRLTADEYWESAKQALAIGKQLGNKIILVGTSTGGTNALQLAAAYPKDVAALVLLSPNIAINNSKAYLLNNHWGLQLAKWITGSAYVNTHIQTPLYKQYWYARYPLEATVALQEMLETTMTKETFAKITQPVLMLYYFKDSLHHDTIVSLPAMMHMFNQLATPAACKFKQAVPLAGDHVLGSYIRSKDVQGVETSTAAFLETVLKIKPLQ